MMADGQLSFDSVLRLYHGKIYSLIFRLLADPDESADLTQEVFVKAYKAYAGFDGSGDSVYPWLCRIAVNTCKNKFKQIGRKTRHEVLSLDTDGPDESAGSLEFGDESADPAGVFEKREMTDAVETAVCELPPEFRLVVVLRDMQGLSYREISEATGLDMDMVKVRLYRGRQVLRRRLAPYLDG